MPRREDRVKPALARGGLRAADIKQWGFLAVVLVLIVWLWNSWAIYPLKILVVFFHELSHALVGVGTGGKVVEIRLEAAEGGCCIIRGGNRLLTLMAGYLGSLVLGGIILVWTSRTRRDKALVTGLGVVILGVGLFFVRPVASFGFLFAAIAGAGLVLAGQKMPREVNGFLLRTIGLTSCLYVVLDIKSDILDRPHLQSDARMLAEITGIPTLVWGIVWIGLALAASIFFIWWAAKPRSGGGRSG